MCARLFPLFTYFVSSSVHCCVALLLNGRGQFLQKYLYICCSAYFRVFCSRDFAAAVAAAAVATTFGFGGSFSTLFAVCAYLFRLFFGCSSRGSVAFQLRFVELNEKKSLSLFAAVRELPVASTTLDARQSSC